MEILRFIPAGKFLTTVHDAGAWYSWASGQKDRFSVSSFSANYSFWNVLCSPKLKDALLSSFSPRQPAYGIDLEVSAEKAVLALKGLCRHSSFSELEHYAGYVADLSSHLEVLNKIQKSIDFSVQLPPRVREVDYSSSESLSDYASRPDTFLYRLTTAALSDLSIGEGGVILVHITSALELLTAMSAAIVIKKKFPGVHICLAEHRYEYFSLDPYMKKLKKSGALLKIFNSVIESVHGAQGLIAALLESLYNKERVYGFINATAYKTKPDTHGCKRVPLDPLPAFSPEPVLWTRLCASGCHWGKCAFCAQVHNGDPDVPAKHFDAAKVKEYLAQCVSAGYRKFSFADEAIAPENIQELCEGILEKKLDILWHCRCRCDMAVEPEILRLMYRAGCREVLFGLETVSARIQTLMGKYATPISADAAEKLFCSVNEAGIGLHISIIGGFPSETASELKQTVECIKTVLKETKGGTYVFNQFELLPGSRMFRKPSDFKISIVVPEGDMPLRYGYILSPEIKSKTKKTITIINPLRTELSTALGWDFLNSGAAAKVLKYLYFSTGHGLIFKSAENNPFENPLKKAVPDIFRFHG